MSDSSESLLRDSFRNLEVSPDFTEAVLDMQDGSKLQFCHRVDVRRVKCFGPESTAAADILTRVRTFRLNAKHLEVEFDDGSSWEAKFR
jgi:hypothetical protein